MAVSTELRLREVAAEVLDETNPLGLYFTPPATCEKCEQPIRWEERRRTRADPDEFTVKYVRSRLGRCGCENHALFATEHRLGWIVSALSVNL